MRGAALHGVPDEPNAYIALADLCINLILILAFCLTASALMSKVGWDQIQYRDRQAAVAAALTALGDPPDILKPSDRNDPIGTQRCVYRQSGTSGFMFVPGTAELTAQGKARISALVRVLLQHRGDWRRVRIEGHTMPTTRAEDEFPNILLSTRRAVAVADVMYGGVDSAEGQRRGIAPHQLAVAGRGGQAPYTPYDNEDPADRARHNADPANERVEIVIEYVNETTVPRGQRPLGPSRKVG